MNEIEFINHASLLIKSNKTLFLTDPWVISPAFGGWVQNPSPLADSIAKIIRLAESHPINIIVSHGHDDHLDEFFIKKHLKKAQFLIPHYKSTGLKKRIYNLTEKVPIEIGEKPFFLNDTEISCFINPAFSQNDAIFVIKDSSDVLIHANDNWHEWPEKTIEGILGNVRTSKLEDAFFLVQFGIADCFPMSYSSIAQAEGLQIVKKRFENYQRATKLNSERLGIKGRCFYYANQSVYPYPNTWRHQSTYELAQQWLNQSKSDFRQLVPGDMIKGGIAKKDGDSIFSFLLKSLEDFVNFQISSNLQVNFITDEKQHQKGSLSYLSSQLIWSRILIGELTLEALSIGGMGTVLKPEGNIQQVHHSISKVAYLIQNMIESKGLSFLLNNPRSLLKNSLQPEMVPLHLA